MAALAAVEKLTAACKFGPLSIKMFKSAVRKPQKDKIADFLSKLFRGFIFSFAQFLIVLYGVN